MSPRLGKALAPHPAARRAGGDAVLFLDFDGVLNNHKTIRRFERLTAELRLLDWLDPDLTQMVGAVAAEFDAMIVVCSSWRDRHDAAKLRATLHARGIPREVDVEAAAGQVTPHGHPAPRIGFHVNGLRCRLGPLPVPPVRVRHLELV